MKKINTLLLLFTIGTISFAQKNNLVNTWNYLRSKEYSKAKTAIDAAALHEDTKNNPKMWSYRAQTYMSILQSKDEAVNNLDLDAAEKAFESVVNCLKTDDKKTYADEVNGLLVPSALHVFNKSIEASNAKQFDNATRYVNILFEALPFDKSGALINQGITSNKLYYQLVSISYASKNYTAAKEYLQKLIDAKCKDSTLYVGMADLYGQEGNIEKQLSYIEQGRLLFPKDPNLIAIELNYYIQHNKTDELLEKVNKAIETTPTDTVLYFTKGTIYQGKMDKEKDLSLKQKYFIEAETSFKKALELKPNYGDANYNLGKLFLDKGIEYNNEANNLPPKESKKIQDLTDKAKAEFTKSIPYLEKAHELDANDATVTKSLLQLYVTTGNNDKYKKLKEEMSAQQATPTK